MSENFNSRFNKFSLFCKDINLRVATSESKAFLNSFNILILILESDLKDSKKVNR